MDTVDSETNVILINNIVSVEYRFYEPAAESRQTFYPKSFEIETTLLSQGCIVSFDSKRRGLWYFHICRRDEAETKPTQQLGANLTIARQSLLSTRNGLLEPTSWFKSLSPGTQTAQKPNGASAPNQGPQSQSFVQQEPSAIALAEQQKEVSVEDAYSPRIIYESFVRSLLLAISFRFCTRSEAVPLNFHTLLLPAQKLSQGSSDHWTGQQSQSLGTLKCYMISTGSLALTFSVTFCPGLASLQDRDPSRNNTDVMEHDILAAPFGALTNEEQRSNHHSAPSTASYTPGMQALPLKLPTDASLSLWKQACLAILQLRGVPMAALRDCTWVNLLIPRHKLHDSKPSDWRRNVSHTVSIPWPGSLCFRKKDAESSATNRVCGAIVIGAEESHDPLGVARDWFNSAHEREEKILKRRTERSAAGPKDGLLTDARTSKINAPSPVMMRRPSTTGANAVYPTPPDALHNLNGITPSIDGNFSSPGHSLSVVADADIDCEPILANSSSNQHDHEMTEAPDSKPLRSDNSLLSEAGNMFEDMGGDMFGENDITEADFSFFDEQPDTLGMAMSVDSIKEINTAEATPMKLHQPDPKSLPAAPEMAVFAKPELKHARSSQMDENSQRGCDLEAPPPGKRGLSPFDPDSVFKRLRAAAGPQGQKADAYTSGTKRSSKVFGKVDFDFNMPMLNKKYEYGGLFDFMHRDKDTTKMEPGALPKTDYLKRHGRSKFKSRGRSRRTSLIKSAHESDGQLLGQQLLILDGDASDAEASSSDSDDSSTLVLKEPPSPVKSTVKLSLVGDDDVASYITAGREQELAEEADGQLAVELSRLYSSEGSSTPLTNYFLDTAPNLLEFLLSDEDTIQIAQLVAEQAATGSLYISKPPAGTGLMAVTEQDGRIKQMAGIRNTLQGLREAASSIIGTVAPVSLKSLLEVEDGSLTGHGNRLQPRPVGSRDVNAEPIKPLNLYQIPCPHLEVRRADLKLSLLPTAVTFWENLGLAPSSGSKDVSGVCVCPEWTGLEDNARQFLGRLKSVYETLKLGTFEMLSRLDDVQDGVLVYGPDRMETAPGATVMSHVSALLESMEKLCAVMSELTLVDTNIVVYLLYSASNPSTIVEACRAFQRLFESYKRVLTTKREVPKNEMVLQLVCIETFSSPASVVATPSPELIRLCMETYDRCTLFGGDMPAPAIRLEPTLPRIIDFKLSVAPSSSLMRENSCIHVAYARSIDGRWVTAAWTDDRGNEQTTAAYCLGRKGEPKGRTMNEVANEIWETTIGLISAWNVRYRIVMTRCGPTEEGEINFWTELAKTEFSANVTLTLMTVDTEPSLQLLPAAIKIPVQSLSLYSTPVSTPQANTVSPEASATPATPARDAANNMAAAAAAATPGNESTGDAEVDSVLVDVMEQTWGGIVGHRLNNSTLTTSIQPALISGYLIKRTGFRAEDVPSIMEVNLVYTEAQPRTYEPLLREILSYFRGLGTLARARGMIDRETDVRPWHVAAAEKTARALNLLM